MRFGHHVVWMDADTRPVVADMTHLKAGWDLAAKVRVNPSGSPMMDSIRVKEGIALCIGGPPPDVAAGLFVPDYFLIESFNGCHLIAERLARWTLP